MLGLALNRFGAVARCSTTRAVHVEARIEASGFKLPAVAVPKGNYVLTNRVNDLVFTAGHLPQPADGELMTGKVGADVSIEEAQHAAKLAFFSMMSSLAAELGDLDRVEKFVKVVSSRCLAFCLQLSTSLTEHCL